MIGAALVAKKAVERGLSRKPWVKTTLAPGSKVVSDYYDRSGLTPYLDKMGFNLVGYGCTTCIGNSGPLIPEVSAAVQASDLAVVSVLSGNRNFEGRINPDIKMNYLASPPLVVAYAIAGTMDIDLVNDSLGTDEHGNDVFLKDIWPSEAEIDEIVAAAIGAEMFTDSYADVFAGDQQWQSLPTPEGETFAWDPDSTYVRKPPYFEGMPADPVPVTDITGARVLLKLGDSITTDHISPAGSIKADGPAGEYLSEHGVDRREFNSYGSRRGNHEVMIRGTFANIRLRNQLAPGTEGGFTRDFTVDGAPVTSVYEASEHYLAAGIPLVILTGKEYGSGSSRDWAAKGTALLGVKAVIAESYERIHRSNLIGMGVLPLQFPEGQTAETLGSDRGRNLRLHRSHRTQQRHHPGHRQRHRRRHQLRRRRPDRHPRRSRLLPQRRHHAIRPPQPAQAITLRPGVPDPGMGHGVGVRRTLHRRLVGLMLVAALIGTAGCSPETSPEPPEPFGEFAVGQFGGVAGLQEILRVRADGNAVLISREPASGRFTEEEMGRLRRLLTSEQFRQEVARELEWKRKPRKIECSDQIITEVSMGALSLSRSGPCGKEDLPDAPAFNEILTIVGPARRGDFAGPVDGSEPRLVPVRLERLATSSRPGYLIIIDRRGEGIDHAGGRGRCGVVRWHRRTGTPCGC